MIFCQIVFINGIGWYAQQIFRQKSSNMQFNAGHRLDNKLEKVSILGNHSRDNDLLDGVFGEKPLLSLGIIPCFSSQRSGRALKSKRREICSL